MSLGTPINWGAPIASPAAQPELFKYQGEGYVRMGTGEILTADNYLSQQSALNNQAWRAAAANYDPNAPTQLATRAMESQPYRSPTTNQPVSREQFFRENSRLNYQASNQYDAAMRSRLANAGSAWDTPLPRGVTVDMIPTGGGSFAPAPTAGAMVPARRGAPVGEALRTPVNQAVKPRSQPISANPAALASAGQGIAYGGLAAYGAYAGGAGFFEGAGAFVGGAVGGVAGGIGGAAGGAALGGGAGTFVVPGIGTVSGAAVGGYVGGGIGSAAGGGIGAAVGQGIGRALDNLIPDFLDPPNALDPNALDPGPLLDPGQPPPFKGGQSPGVFYTVRATVTTAGNNCETVSGSSELNGVRGPISFRANHNSAFSAPQGGLCPGFGSNEYYFTTQGIEGLFAGSGRGVKVEGISVSRSDGLPDTGGDPPGAVAPTRGQNPARRPAGAAPRPLPSPLPPPAPTDQPWPQAPARETPDTTPITPPSDVPNFSPSTAGEAVETPTSTPPADPIDLAAPPSAPQPFGDPNTTAPIGDIGKSLGGSGGKPLPKPSVLEVVVPIILLEGLRQQANTPSGNLVDRSQPNPNLQIVKPPPVQTTTTPNPPTCIYERQRVMDIQNKATSTEERASSPVSGFTGLYGLQIESRTKLGQTFDLLGNVDKFARKAWETTRMQKILDVMTFVGVLHNMSMLSRDVGETFLELVGQGLQAAGIRDEENKVIDVQEVFAENVEGLLINTLGAERYRGISTAFNKANRIISTASATIWTIRSIADSTQDLTEWIGENTGRIGNALKRWGIVGENAYPTMSESAKSQHRMRTRFNKFTDTAENLEDRISVYTQATSAIIEVQDETKELGENFKNFKASVVEGIPDPWLDNTPVKAADDEAKANSETPPINPSDSQKG